MYDLRRFTWQRFKARVIHQATSFIGLHYMYIILNIIIGSVILYGQRNMAYIDALFTASGVSTQSGLSTVYLNDLKLYQQVYCYLGAMTCTPIFIHSSVVFFRLRWFEKYFQGINEQSKVQSRMRRTATMARDRSFLQQSATNDPLSDVDVESGLQEKRQEPEGEADVDRADRVDRVDREDQSESPQGAGTIVGTSAGTSAGTSDETEFAVEILDDEQRQAAFERLHSPSQGQSLTSLADQSESPSSGSAEASAAVEAPGTPDMDVRFADLPLPPRSRAVGPKDLYMSLSMMARSRRQSSDVNDGPALVIKSPRAIDQEEHRGGTHKQSSFADSINEDSGHATGILRPIASFLRSRRGSTFPGSDDEDEGASDRADANVRTDTDPPIPQRRFTRTMSANYLSWEPTVGRNSNFVDLTPEQKEELGGVEYRALKLLAKILIGYYAGMHILAAVMLLPWSVRVTKYAELSRSLGYSPAWWAFFTGASAFNDVGFTLNPDSMMSYQHAVYVLLTLSFFIVVGNTGFPCMLRLVIWTMFRLSPRYGRTRESLGFLLDHPRRCFTLLFPSGPTWWLFAVLIVLNGVDLILFIVLDLNAHSIESIPRGYRVMDGLFQAFSMRTAGFQSVNIANLHAAVQVSYMIMMYISVLPIAISIRRTNVYEEQSLGVYYNQRFDETDEEAEERKHPSYVSNHLRRQLSFDLWYIMLGLFVIAIAEGPKIQDNSDPLFNTFTVLYEIVSAYGTVGTSLGYPTTNLSFSSQFGVVSKLVIIAMMVRGRHRGLPYAIDRAVIVPSKKLEKKDTVQAGRVITKRVLSNPPLPRTLSGSSTTARPRGLLHALSMRSEH